MIPIAHGSSATAWKADVTGAVSSPLDGEQFAAIDPGGREQLTWMQAASPSTFYCADATDGDSLRVCQNVFESLYGFKPGTAQVTPALAESCAPNQQLTVWTCHLRGGVDLPRRVEPGRQRRRRVVCRAVGLQAADARRPHRAVRRVGWRVRPLPERADGSLNQPLPVAAFP